MDPNLPNDPNLFSYSNQSEKSQILKTNNTKQSFQQQHEPSSSFPKDSNNGNIHGQKSNFFNKWFQTMKTGRKFVKPFLFMAPIGCIVYLFYRSQNLINHIPDSTILKWELNRMPIYETHPKIDDLGSLYSASQARLKHMTFLELLEVLRFAKDDTRVKGLIVDFSAKKINNTVIFGMAQVQELRRAVYEFKEAKRKQFGKVVLIAYTDTFLHQSQYHLASAFDQIAMEPLGTLNLIGTGTRRWFYKDLLERIGIEMNAFTRDAHKGVYQQFTENAFTEPVKNNLTSLFSSLNSEFVKDIVRQRFIKFYIAHEKFQEKEKTIGNSDVISDGMVHQDGNKLEKSNNIHSNLSTSSTELASMAKRLQAGHDILKATLASGSLDCSQAVQWGLIDKIVQAPSMKVTDLVLADELKKNGYNLKDIKVYFNSKSKDEDRRLKIEMNKQQRQKNSNNKISKVGLVYLCGNMNIGSSHFGSQTISNALFQAAKDNSISSIVLRINSGGGAAVAAETIHQAVEYAKHITKKPVVASFGNVAASGGYYAAAGCDKIFALPMTITGSIGVAAARPLIKEKLMETLSLNQDEIALTENFKNTALTRSLEGKALENFEASLDRTYDLFLKRVSQGRRLPVDQLRSELAGGRVWSGIQAKHNGLIDKFGGLQDAIVEAANLAEKQNDMQKQQSVTHQKNTIERANIEVKVFPPKRSILQILGGEDGVLDVSTRVSVIMKQSFRAALKEMVEEILYQNSSGGHVNGINDNSHTNFGSNGSTISSSDHENEELYHGDGNLVMLRIRPDIDI